MFVCGACSKPELAIVSTLELPPDDDDDDTVQHLRCSACHTDFLGRYTESRRGSLDRESWHHRAFPLGDRDGFLAALGACPSPRDRRCTCATHAALAADIHRYVVGDSFSLVRVR